MSNEWINLTTGKEVFDRQAADEIDRLREELEQAWQERNEAVAKQANDLEFFNNRLSASKAREEAYRAEVVKLSGELAKAQQAQEPVAELRISSHASDQSLIVKWCSALPAGSLLYTTPQSAEVERDAFPQAHRLALELECLLLDTKDTAAFSKWWDSANEALEQWRQFCDAMKEKP